MPHPPTLRTKILETLVIEGRQLSIKMLEGLTGHQHADISDAIKNLKEQGMVDGPYPFYPPETQVHKRRRHLGYTINENGLKYILPDCEPSKFWEILFSYCYSQKETISRTLVRKLYKAYLQKYLGYSVLHAFHFTLDSVNLFCETCFNDFQKSGRYGHITEKALEALAMNRSLTRQELSEHTHEDQSTIEQILVHYSSIGSKSNTVEKNDEFKSDSSLLSQVIQIVPSQLGKEKLELTLIGVVLVLYLIRKRDMDILDSNLPYSNYSIEEYYMKVATNYHDKLPLIFGKWYKLKNILGVMCTYNLDIILDRKFRSDSLSSSGNSVLYNCMRDISVDCKKLLSRLQANGILEMMNFVGKNYSMVDKDYHKARRIICNKLLPVYELWCKLTFALDEEGYGYEYIKQKLSKDDVLQSDSIERISSVYSVETLEHSLDKEITALYYMNLNNPYSFPTLPSNYLTKFVAQFDHVTTKHPLWQISSMLQEDKEIRDVVQGILQDAVRYHEKLAKIIESSKTTLGVY